MVGGSSGAAEHVAQCGTQTIDEALAVLERRADGLNAITVTTQDRARTLRCAQRRQSRCRQA